MMEQKTMVGNILIAIYILSQVAMVILIFRIWRSARDEQFRSPDRAAERWKRSLTETK